MVMLLLLLLLLTLLSLILNPITEVRIRGRVEGSTPITVPGDPGLGKFELAGGSGIG